MAEIKQININNATYDINLPSGVSVDVKTVKAANGVTAGSVTATSITDTSLKNRKVIGTSSEGTLEAHELAISDIKDLQTTLNGKAPSSHTHTIGQITNLENALNNCLPKTGGTLSGVVAGGVIDVHPENGGTILSYYTNDLAFLTQRGGSYIMTNTTKNTVLASSSNNNAATNMFDGSPSYYNFSVSAVTDTIVIVIKSPNTYSYSTMGGIGFGNAYWGAKSVKIEMGYSATNKGTAQSPDSDVKWATRINLTNNDKGVVYGDLSGPGTSDGGTSSQTWSYMRLTLSNFNSTGPRIAQIFTVNYGSTGMHHTFLGLGGGTVYGSLNVKDRLTVNGSAVALKSDIKSSTAKGTTGISVSASLAAAPAFTGTAHGHTITDNGHTHTYSKAKASGTTSVLNAATFKANYSNYGISFDFTTGATTAVTGIGWDTVNSGSAKTEISLANATAGGSVSKPNVNVSVTDPGHTHTI